MLTHKKMKRKRSIILRLVDQKHNFVEYLLFKFLIYLPLRPLVVRVRSAFCQPFITEYLMIAYHFKLVHTILSLFYVLFSSGPFSVGWLVKYIFNRVVKYIHQIWSFYLTFLWWNHREIKLHKCLVSNFKHINYLKWF